MKKVKKYYYNTKTLRFEKLEVPVHIKLLRVIGFISASLVYASIIVAIAFRFLDSPKERVMRQNMATMEERIRLVQDQLRSMSNELEQLEQRDNDVYRSIFETAPLPDSIRLGRSARELETDDYAYRETDDLLAQLTLQLDNLKHRLKMQR